MYIYIVYIFFEIIFIGYNVIISSLGCRFLNIFFQFVRKAHTHTHTHTQTHDVHASYFDCVMKATA